MRIQLYTYIVLLFLSMTALTGCSDGIHPENLEPTFELSDAFNVTRNEATVTVSINKHGSSSLSYIKLYIGKANGGTPQEITGNTIYDNILFKLENLQPGTKYKCYAEGGTTTATLRSNTITFTTDPNEAPKVSEANPISSGPLSIIVEFEIYEDGGAAITEAGCEIMDANSKELRKICLAGEDIEKGKYQINISELKPQTEYLITTFATNSIGKATGEPLEYITKNSIVLRQAGQLSALFDNGEIFETDTLTISGYMNGDDFKTLRGILGANGQIEENITGIKVANLDLTEVEITAGGGPYDGNRYTVPNELSNDIFADCERLQSVILPNSAIVVGRNAFARCKALETITVSGRTEQVFPSSGCLSLKNIEVSANCSNFKSIDGVLFNKDATQIIWYPYGKSGDYLLPSTITTIGEYAFSETSITSLIIPASVTTISRGAFAGSALTEISLPDNMAKISEGIFQGCQHLSTVYLGSGTEFIGNFAFDGTSVRSLYVAAKIPPFASENAFANGGASICDECTLFIPQGTKTAYGKHSEWSKFKQIEEF